MMAAAQAAGSDRSAASRPSAVTTACARNALATWPVVPKIKMVIPASPGDRTRRSSAYHDAPGQFAGLSGKRASDLACLAQPFADAVAVEQRAPPVLVRQIPVDGARQPLLDRDRGLPAQLIPDAAGVDGITQVMSGPVRDEGDQPVMRRALGAALIQQGADRADQIDIAPLVVATDVVAPPQRALFANQQQGIGV